MLHLLVCWLTAAAIAPHMLGGAAASANDITSATARSFALATSSRPNEAIRVPISETYGKLPLYFEANRGQSDAQVKFLARGPEGTIFLTSTEMRLLLTRREPPARNRLSHRGPALQAPTTATAVRMTLAGASTTPRVSGLEELPGKVNYFIGNDPAAWRTNVPTYAKVRYDDVYPGIDVIYYGNQRQLEYDIIVRPGADPSRIVLDFQGADRLEVDGRGDLVLHTAAGPIHQRKPVIYQDIDGVRREVQGGYRLANSRQVSFRLAAYVASQPLIIDPVLSYSTYLGGSASDWGAGIAVDTAGNAYVTGSAPSPNFPTTTGAFQTTTNFFLGRAFVTKLDATGSALVYSTYLGGRSADAGLGIAVDAAGNAYVTGATFSGDFPTTAGAFQTTYGGAFVTKLDPTGSALVYSTFLGGLSSLEGGAVFGSGIALDAAGNAYVTGSAGAFSFPTTVGAFQTTRIFGGTPAFVTKLNPSGTALVYSTFLGGRFFQTGAAIAVDAAGNAYVTGDTQANDFPTTVGAFQTTFGRSVAKAFVTKLNPPASALVYSTYLGGSDFDRGLGIAVDTAGNAYVTGQARSSDFPTTPGAFQTTFRSGPLGGSDAFVTKIDPTGSTLVYSTYLAGGGDDAGSAIAVDARGNAYVTGYTASIDFPTTTGAVQITSAGDYDAFVAALNPTGSAPLIYSTYLGGSNADAGGGIALDAAGNAYITGGARSSNFPTTAGAFQTTFGGATGGGGAVGDAFVAKIAGIAPPPPPTAGKVTGGGSVDVPGGVGTFGFGVKRKEADAPIRGHLEYVNHATKAKVHSVSFESLTINGNTATFAGTCKANDAPCTFSVTVQDNGKPGTGDHFTITVDARLPEGDALRSGDIKIQHPRGVSAARDDLEQDDDD